jgi:hypothetical protein
MKEKPILYSTEMVLANLEGRKNQTRRTNNLDKVNDKPDNWEFKGFIPYATPEAIFINRYTGVTLAIKCPYGGAGDVLWVRETFAKTLSDEYLHQSTKLPYFYKADVLDSETEKEVMTAYGWKYKPSIHMPKAAARIWLQVESIGVERVQDISEQDAIAEGIDTSNGLPVGMTSHYIDYIDARNCFTSAINSFKSLWQSINGEESWQSNPWVWVIKYKVLSTTGKPTNL